jgi:nucleotide-binding universal stress UspA family protein
MSHRTMTSTLERVWPDAVVDHRAGTLLGSREVPELVFGVEGGPNDGRAIRELPSLCWGLDHAPARLRIVHVVTVPMTLPLDAELPEADAAAAGILGRANLAAASVGLPARTGTVRARSVAGGLIEAARRSSAGGIVVPLHRREGVGAHVVLSRTARTLLKSAPCPVSLLHLPHGDRDGGPADESFGTSRRRRGVRGWLASLWEKFLVACVIADTSTFDSCGTCVSARPYLEETMRILALGRITPRA